MNKKAFRANAKTLKYELRIDSISPRLVKRLKKDKKSFFQFRQTERNKKEMGIFFKSVFFSLLNLFVALRNKQEWL